jgi:hypothetical protein
VGVGGSSALCGLSGARGATERVWRSTFCMVHHHPSLEQLRPLPPLTDTWTILEGRGGSKVELTIPTQRLFLAHPVPASLARHTISPPPPPRRRALPFGNAAPARRSLAARLPPPPGSVRRPRAQARSEGKPLFPCEGVGRAWQRTDAAARLCLACLPVVHRKGLARPSVWTPRCLSWAQTAKASH